MAIINPSKIKVDNKALTEVLDLMGDLELSGFHVHIESRMGGIYIVLF